MGFTGEVGGGASLTISTDSEDPFLKSLKGLKACSANSSDPNEEPMLSASDSEELDVVTSDAVTAFCDLSSDHTSGLLLPPHESLEHERLHLFTLLGFMSTTQASGVNALNCWPA